MGKEPLNDKKKRKKNSFQLSSLIPMTNLQYDTMEDIWDDISMFARKVEDPVTYPINDDEVLIEYAQDGSSITLHEKLSFNSPHT